MPLTEMNFSSNNSTHRKGKLCANGLRSVMHSLLLATFCVACSHHRAETQITRLSNGISVVVVYFPGSTNESIFTFSSVGLSGDAHNQAQWSHLVEHLIIRTTVPGDLTHANAETLADHMRLDTYGSTNDWQSWLSQHKRWIQGIPFTETSLQKEKPRVISECDTTAKNFATYKFALAAWANGTRHGLKHIGLKQDVLQATLKEVQALRDDHFAVPGSLTICLAGGVSPALALAVVKEQLEDIKLNGKLVATVKTQPANADLT